MFWSAYVWLSGAHNTDEKSNEANPIKQISLTQYDIAKELRTVIAVVIMTSSKGNIFQVTGP